MSGQNEQTMASAALNSFDGVAGYGSFIPPEVVESAVGLSREHRKYGLRVVRLIWGLEALLEAQHGRRFTMKQQNFGVSILTLPEAATYLHARFVSGSTLRRKSHLRADVAVTPHLEELSKGQRELFVAQQHMNARLLLHDEEVEAEAPEDEAS